MTEQGKVRKTTVVAGLAAVAVAWNGGGNGKTPHAAPSPADLKRMPEASANPTASPYTQVSQVKKGAKIWDAPLGKPCDTVKGDKTARPLMVFFEQGDRRAPWLGFDPKDLGSTACKVAWVNAVNIAPPPDFTRK